MGTAEWQRTRIASHWWHGTRATSCLPCLHFVLGAESHHSACFMQWSDAVECISNSITEHMANQSNKKKKDSFALAPSFEWAHS